MSWLLFSLLLQSGVPAQAQNKTPTSLAIVAGASFPRNEITAKDLKAYYLGETQLLNDIWIHPIDQRESQPIRKTFLEKIVHMTRDRYIAHWNQRLFQQGGFSPLLKNNSREVIETVRAQDGALGYVWLEDARNEAGIKILLVLDTP